MGFSSLWVSFREGFGWTEASFRRWDTASSKAPCRLFEGEPLSEKGEQEFVDLGLQLIVQSKAGVHLLEQLKDLRFVLHDPAQVDLGVADAFGVLDIMIPGIGDGNEHLRVFEIPHVEEQILRPVDIGRKAELVFRDDLPAVEFVPQHAVVKEAGCCIRRRA